MVPLRWPHILTLRPVLRSRGDTLQAQQMANGVYSTQVPVPDPHAGENWERKCKAAAKELSEITCVPAPWRQTMCRGLKAAVDLAPGGGGKSAKLISPPPFRSFVEPGSSEKKATNVAGGQFRHFRAFTPIKPSDGWRMLELYPKAIPNGRKPAD
jgi:hypothetical protein